MLSPNIDAALTNGPISLQWKEACQNDIVLKATLLTWSMKKINMQIARINQIELINFYQDVKLAGVDIDFNQMYYVVAEAGRGYITIRQ